MKREMPSGAQTPDGITFSCSNLFKTLSPIFSFTMGLTGHTRKSFAANGSALTLPIPESTGIRKGTPPPERLKSLKKRFGRILTDWFGSPARDTLHTGGSAKSRLSSVIAQEQMCAKLRTLPSRVKHISLFEKSAIFSWRTAGMLFHESRKIEFRTESKFSRHLSQSN